MTPLQRLANAVHIITLSLWAGAIATTGFLAAIAFPTMKDLDPTLPNITADNAEHWRIAAGNIFNKAFSALNQWDALGHAVPSLAFIFWFIAGVAMSIGVNPRQRPRRKMRTFFRVRVLVFFVIIIATAAVDQTSTQMSELLTTLTAAAESGDEQRLEETRAAFDALHDIVSREMAFQLAAVLLAALLAAIDGRIYRAPNADADATETPSP